MSRILSQPIYRDALLTGKFLGGLMVLGICLLTLWLLVTGLGILTLGLPPSGEELLRGVAFLIASLAYSGVWLAIALLFSTLFRAPATSALAALTLWLLFAVFWGMLTPLIAGRSRRSASTTRRPPCTRSRSARRSRASRPTRSTARSRWRCSIRRRARSGSSSFAAAGRAGRRAASLRPERHPRLAAALRPDRGDGRRLHRRLCVVPAAGDTRLARPDRRIVAVCPLPGKSLAPVC